MRGDEKRVKEMGERSGIGRLGCWINTYIVDEAVVTKSNLEQ